MATVNASGLVTAQTNGVTTVTVASGSVSQSVSVVVEQGIAKLLLPINAVELAALGATTHLKVAAQDANGHSISAELAWESADPKIATVDADGWVTAQDNGTTTISVVSGPVTASASVTVRQRLTAVIVSTAAATLEALGEQVQLVANAHDADGRTMAAEVRWNSSEPSVATVDASGLVTALARLPQLSPV